MTDKPVCSFGFPWLWHVGPVGCLWCAAEVERACRAFDDAVSRGEYDAQGYSVNERKSQQRKDRPV